MNQYNNFVYYREYLEDLHVNEEIHKCPDCGEALVLHCEIRPGKSGLSCFDEVWICPNCR